MKYLEWNNIIARHFFNSGNAGQDVHLYITKREVIQIGKQYLTDRDESSIWKDFVLTIEKGLPGAKGNIVEKARDAFERRALLKIDSVNVVFPPYIAYLVFFVMPLIEVVEGDFNSNNYFTRLNKFLDENGIKQKITSLHFRDYNINNLWAELSNWAVVKNSGDLGSFTVKPFRNNNWIYVGKMFSQCVLPPAAMKKFPEFFLESQMVPNSFYSKDDLKQKFVSYGLNFFDATILELVRKSDFNELGQSIIEITNREYNKWSGESHEIILNGAKETTKRNFTVAQLLLQFKLNENEGIIKFSFRIYSSNDYPEDLKFEGYENIYESKGFSKTLTLPERTKLVPFELIDSFNNWLARFPQKDVRLFIGGNAFQLSTGYWIETDTLSKTDWMYLLCNSEKREIILDWGKHFRQGNFFEEDLEGIPPGFFLFKFLNPTISCEGVSLLTLYTDKIIQLVGGIKVSFRVFLSDFLPDVEIINSDGTEKVFLQYKTIDEKVTLKKKQARGNLWLLPEDIFLDTDFYIRIDGADTSANEIAHSISDSYSTSHLLDENHLPKRDSFGKKVEIESNAYSTGINVVGVDWKRQEIYKQFFTGIKEDLFDKTVLPHYNHHEGNILLSFLTLKRISNTEDFYKAFEFLYSNKFAETSSNTNFSILKRSSLNFFNYLGYLDYDYEEKRIVATPTQLIFIPAVKGRKTLLIGGRDEELVNLIIEKAPKYNLQVNITNQFSTNENLLLPDAITIQSFGKRTENFGERNLMALSQDLQIKFTPTQIAQFGLQSFSADIEEYIQDMIDSNQTNEDDYDWARRTFNVDTLEFERTEPSSFDKTFALVEYKLNEYTFINKLWLEGKCFLVDKNWGRYLALNHYKKQVILYNEEKHQVAIPIQLPLPRLLAQSIMLLSGLAPVYTRINSRLFRVYENVPSPFIKNLFDKLKQQPLLVNFR